MALRRLVLHAMIGPCLTVSLVALVLLTVGTLAQVLLQSAVVPDLDLLTRIGGGAFGVAAPLALLVGGVSGAAVAGARLREEGAWLAMRSLGVGPGTVLGAVAAGTLLLAAMIGGAMHAVEPAARTAMRQARVAAAVRVRPSEGRTLQMGAWSVAVEGGVLHFIGDAAVGAARTWRLEPAQSGVVARLEDVVVRDPGGGWTAGAATLSVPVGLPGTAGKVHVTERGTMDLVAQLRLHPGDDYERWILWKRSVVPIGAALAMLAAFGLTMGRAWPAAPVAGSAVLALWVGVRVCDGAIRTLAAPGAAVVLLGAGLMLTLFSWRRVA